MDVATGAERLAGTGEYNHPHPPVCTGRVHGLVHLRSHLIVPAIELLRAVEGDGGNALLHLIENGLIAHTGTP